MSARFQSNSPHLKVMYRPTSGSRTALSTALARGNPDVMAGVSPSLVVGSGTEVIAGEKLILTAGALDAHIHFICPQQVTEALACRYHNDDRWRNRPECGTERDNVHTEPVGHAFDDERDGWASDELRYHGKG